MRPRPEKTPTLDIYRPRASAQVHCPRTHIRPDIVASHAAAVAVRVPCVPGLTLTCTVIPPHRTGLARAQSHRTPHSQHTAVTGDSHTHASHGSHLQARASTSSSPARQHNCRTELPASCAVPCACALCITPDTTHKHKLQAMATRPRPTRCTSKRSRARLDAERRHLPVPGTGFALLRTRGGGRSRAASYPLPHLHRLPSSPPRCHKPLPHTRSTIRPHRPPTRSNARSGAQHRSHRPPLASRLSHRGAPCRLSTTTTALSGHVRRAEVAPIQQDRQSSPHPAGQTEYRADCRE